MPLTGWLTQRLDAVHLFVASIVLFTLASLQLLIACRVVQGAAGELPEDEGGIGAWI